MEARVHCRTLISATLRRIADDPSGAAMVDRSDLFFGLRSLHLRHGRNQNRESPVAQSGPVVFYRVVEPGLVEVVRVLHERMNPVRHLV